MLFLGRQPATQTTVTTEMTEDEARADDKEKEDQSKADDKEKEDQSKADQEMEDQSKADEVNK